MNELLFTRPRLLAAVGAALLIAGGLGVARLGTASSSEAGDAARALDDLRTLREQVNAYHSRLGAYPHGLASLVPQFASRFPFDPWGRPYRLEFGERGPIISTLGRDGVRGGQGADADLSTLDLRE